MAFSRPILFTVAALVVLSGTTIWFSARRGVERVENAAGAVAANEASGESLESRAVKLFSGTQAGDLSVADWNALARAHRGAVAKVIESAPAEAIELGLSANAWRGRMPPEAEKELERFYTGPGDLLLLAICGGHPDGDPHGAECRMQPLVRVGNETFKASFADPTWRHLLNRTAPVTAVLIGDRAAVAVPSAADPLGFAEVPASHADFAHPDSPSTR